MLEQDEVAHYHCGLMLALNGLVRLLSKQIGSLLTELNGATLQG